MNVKVWHDEEAYARRSLARPLDDVKRDMDAFHDELRALADRYGIADVFCITEANVSIDGKVVSGFKFSHHGDNARICPMMARAYYNCVAAGVVEAEADE